MNFRSAVMFACVVGLSGCAIQPQEPSAPTFEHLMFQADERIKGGNLERAKTLLTEAARIEPTRKEPWLRKAEVEFENENYGASIIASQEALQRAPGDVYAESIQTVAGLRIAVQSLARLRDESDVNGPVHTEARKLAAKLRETLGAKALVTKQKARAPKPKPPAAKAVPTSYDSNPFSSLSGSN